MKRIATLLLAMCVIAGFTAAAIAGGECCEKPKADNGWCKSCSVGYFDGVTMTSKKLHDTLAGTKVEADKLQCQGCVTAVKSDGTCCKHFYAGGYSYQSPYAAAIAKGKHVTGDMKCESCAKAAKTNGWCDTCNVGLAGNYAFKDKKDHEKAVAALTTIQSAAKAKCEPCAVAMVSDAKCEPCGKSFKDGKPVKL